MDSKQFTLKQSVAAMSGTMLVLVVTLLTVANINDCLLASLFFASISLPALSALPMLDSQRSDKKKYASAVLGFASLFGYGGFFLCITMLIYSFSTIGGIAFFVSAVIWLACVLSINKQPHLK